MAKVAILTGYGINADNELKEAFLRAGAECADRIHINDMIEKPEILDSYQILGFPGGFSFGDHLGSGLVMAHLFKQNLKGVLDKFIAKGKLIIGICNGFQVLVKMGVLPNFDGNWTQEVSLIHNNTGVFENSWLNVRFNPDSPCVWTKGLKEMDIPIRHGEGRFITKYKATLETSSKQEPQPSALFPDRPVLLGGVDHFRQYDPDAGGRHPYPLPLRGENLDVESCVGPHLGAGHRAHHDHRGQPPFHGEPSF